MILFIFCSQFLVANIGLTVGELSINEDDGFATVCSLLSVGQLCANALLNIETDNISNSSKSKTCCYYYHS